MYAHSIPFKQNCTKTINQYFHTMLKKIDSKFKEKTPRKLNSVSLIIDKMESSLLTKSNGSSKRSLKVNEIDRKAAINFINCAIKQESDFTNSIK